MADTSAKDYPDDQIVSSSRIEIPIFINGLSDSGTRFRESAGDLLSWPGPKIGRRPIEEAPREPRQATMRISENRWPQQQRLPPTRGRSPDGRPAGRPG